MNYILPFLFAALPISAVAQQSDMRSFHHEKSAELRLQNKQDATKLMQTSATGNTALLDSVIYLNPDRANNKKISYTYDANGRMTKQEGYYWDNDQWNMNSKSESTYDANGRLTRESFFDGYTGQWEEYEKNEYTYDASGNQTLVITSNYSDDNWVSCHKVESTYDDNGRLTRNTYFDGDNGQWEEYKKTEYTYANGRLTKEAGYNWDDSQNTWNEGYDKAEYTYDSNGNLTKKTNYYEIDTGSNSIKFKKESIYDANGNLTTILDYTEDKNVWVEYTKVEYVYDSKGNLINGFSYYKSAGTWVATAYQIYYRVGSNGAGISEIMSEHNANVRKVLVDGRIVIVNGDQQHGTNGVLLK